MSKYFDTPFAESGDRVSVPSSVQPDGSVSYLEGWGPDYEADQLIDSNAKDVDRQRENQLKNDITGAIKDIQEKGILTYRTDVNYTINSFSVGSDGVIYKALISNGPLSAVVNPVGDVTGTWDIYVSNGSVKHLDFVTDIDTSTNLVGFDTLRCNFLNTRKVNGGGGAFVRIVSGTADNGTERQDASGGWWRRDIQGTGFVQWFDAVGDGIVDDTDAINEAITVLSNKGYSVGFGSGLFLIDPSKSVLIDISGIKLYGNGIWNSALLAKFNVAGSVLKRTFDPTPALPGDNPRVDDCQFRDFGIFLNHTHQATAPANIQIGFNFSNLSRTKEERLYSGNFRFGLAATLYPNAVDKREAMRGYPYLYGNVSASDPAYAGGEVHDSSYCKAWWGRKGIAVDDTDLTGGVSAAYNTVIKHADIQTVEQGIHQGSQFNTGCSFENNLLQDLKTAAGSTNDVFVYDIAGFDNKVDGGYVETLDADLTACIHLATTANNNIINPFRHSVSDAKFIQDDSSIGAENIVSRTDENDKLKVTEGGTEYRPARALARVTWEESGGSANILRSHNVLGVVRNGVGDYTITWAPPVDSISTVDRNVNLNALSNASAHVLVGYIRTQASNTTRVVFRNISSSINEDFPKMSATLN